MMRSRMIHAAAIGCLAVVGCASPRVDREAQFVTRAELRESIDSLFDQPASADAIARLASEAVTPPVDPSDVATAARAEDSAGRFASILKDVEAAQRAVARNIENADTIAFKASVPQFVVGRELVVHRSMKQGTLASTNRQLDVAISGPGLFKVKDDRGALAYTRSGHFFVSPDMLIVCARGDKVRLDPPIAIPVGTSEIGISEDGEMQVITPGRDYKTKIGNIELALFENPEQLKESNDGLYYETAASGPPRTARAGRDGAGFLISGFLETSNVELTRQQLRYAFLSRWRDAILRAINAH